MTVKRPSLQERYYREVAKEPYVFDWADREWTLPHLQSLDYRLQTQIANFGSLDNEGLSVLFTKLLGEKQAADWAEIDVPGDFLALVFQDWTEYSGDDPGEDSASNASSTNTGTRSRRTSAGTTGSASPRRSSARKAAKKAVSPPASSSA